ncbi:hypothetical protein ACWT_5524 [Actinoplanes sp. SE50]|uniref:hypothetical protein n=1 Tax=unclassified Actinoplanes TaxID=2626549 RepID=UPI00023ECB90|nr:MULTISPECIES: hypothetical protein [unclassified Actinoplanes]AEV86541.1 hypothetical protein ACPL_5654 [Actinoplanes sp. SE50/110]ATO84939.1 hypothetical protein ACWT_5524 [Actinoplanes sp. SE50]SLM02348.1 hypothetical protein ACSP50_5587 [Actinoplanes sp. SE50/110]
MTAGGWIALGIAVFGSLCYAAGSILQAVGARRSTSAVTTLGHPLYLVGIGLDMTAWLGSMVALRQLAVYLVESVLAGSLALTAFAAWAFLGSPLRKRDVAAIGVTIGALAGLAMSAGQQHVVAASFTLRLSFIGALIVVLGLGFAATRIGSPGLIATIGGLSVGAAALGGRALHLPDEQMRTVGSAAMAILGEPLTYVLLLFAANGMVMYANALQSGEVGRVTAIHWTAEVIAPSVIALTLLGDTFRPGWWPVALAAAVITVGCAVVLASAPATATLDETAALPAGAEPHALPAPPLPVLPGAPGHPVTALVPLQAWRLAIPIEARWPALQPPLVRGYGTVVWWGPSWAPLPIWVPPDRTLVPRDRPKLADRPQRIWPARVGPQLPESRRPARHREIIIPGRDRDAA